MASGMDIRKDFFGNVMVLSMTSARDGGDVKNVFENIGAMDERWRSDALDLSGFLLIKSDYRCDF